MPIVKITTYKKDAHFAKIAGDAIQNALHEVFDVPKDDRFHIVSMLTPEEFIFDRNFYDIERSDDFMIVDITLGEGRTVEMKVAFYKRVTELLAENLGTRPEDVLITLNEAKPENFSLGLGRAQFVEKLPERLKKAHLD